jgi:phosphomannomutase
VLSFIDPTKLKPLKIVVDAGNGMAGKVIPMLFKNLPFTVIPLFFELDGNFPNHPSNPLEPKSQIAIIKKVLEENRNKNRPVRGEMQALRCLVKSSPSACRGP